VDFLYLCQLMNIYYLEGQEQRGPFDRAGFVQLVHSGVIQPDTLVYTAELKNWKTYREAYYDLFPESRPAFPVARPATPQTRPPAVPAAASRAPSGAPAPQAEEEYESSGLFASLMAAWSLYGKWVIIAAVLGGLAMAGSWMSQNREKWMEDALTMKDREFKAGEAKSGARKARGEWKKAARFAASGEWAKARDAYDKGYEHIDFFWRFHRTTEVKNGETVDDLVTEAIKPFHEVLDDAHQAKLKQYAEGQIDGETYFGFFEQFQDVVNSRLASVHREQISKVDAARAKFADQIFRIEFLLSHPDGEEGETEEFKRLVSLIETEVRSKAQAPAGCRVEYGRAAGPLEEEATLFTATVGLGADYAPYYFNNLTGQPFSQMELDYKERRYAPEFYVVHGVRIQILGPMDIHRAQRNGVQTNWMQTANFGTQVPVVEKVKLSDNAGAPERLIVMAKYQQEVTRELMAKVAQEFKLPPMQSSVQR